MRSVDIENIIYETKQELRQLWLQLDLDKALLIWNKPVKQDQ